jgi:hypothetical protein
MSAQKDRKKGPLFNAILNRIQREVCESMAAKIGAMHASDVWLESAETNAKDRTALFGHPDSLNTNHVRLAVLNRFESGVMLKGRCRGLSCVLSS